MATGTRSDLTDVAGAGIANAVTVGVDGTVLRCGPVDCAKVLSLTRNALSAVSCDVAGADCWIVGSNGTIVRLRADGAALVSTPTTEHLTDVEVTVSGAWAVGEHGTLLEFDGSVWTRVPTGLDSRLLGIDVSGDGNGWIVGEDGRRLVLQNGSWTEASPRSPWIFVDVAALTGHAAWFITMENYYESAIALGDWSDLQIPYGPTPYLLHAVDAADSDEAWAVGAHHELSDDGIILHKARDGQWRFQSAAPVVLWGIDSGPGYAWAAGNGGTVMRYAEREVPQLFMPLVRDH